MGRQLETNTCLVSIGFESWCPRRAFTRTGMRAIPATSPSRDIGAKAQPPCLRLVGCRVGRDAPLAGKGLKFGLSVGLPVVLLASGMAPVWSATPSAPVRTFFLASEGCGMAGLPRQRPGHRSLRPPQWADGQAAGHWVTASQLVWAQPRRRGPGHRWWLVRVSAGATWPR